MKKNEPLKGKMMTIPIFIETNVYRDEEIFKFEDVKSAVEGLISDLEAERVGIFPSIDDDDYNIFYADCVKSAVLGLLEEIEAKKKEIDASLSAILNKTKKDTAVNRGALYGWGEALFWIKGKIKKQFPNVFENEK